MKRCTPAVERIVTLLSLSLSLSCFILRKNLPHRTAVVMIRELPRSVTTDIYCSETSSVRTVGGRFLLTVHKQTRARQNFSETSLQQVGRRSRADRARPRRENKRTRTDARDDRLGNGRRRLPTKRVFRFVAVRKRRDDDEDNAACRLGNLGRPAFVDDEKTKNDRTRLPSPGPKPTAVPISKLRPAEQTPSPLSPFRRAFANRDFHNTRA